MIIIISLKIIISYYINYKIDISIYKDDIIFANVFCVSYINI